MLHTGDWLSREAKLSQRWLLDQQFHSLIPSRNDCLSRCKNLQNLEQKFLLTKFGPGQIAILVYPLYTGRRTEGGAIAVSLAVSLHLNIQLLIISLFSVFHCNSLIISL